MRSLVEEMQTESNEEITESEEVQQGPGKRVIGKRQDQIRLVDNFMPHRFHIGDGTQ